MKIKRVRKIKIQTRLMISFISLIIIISLIANAVLFIQDEQSMMSDLQEKVSNLAASATLLVDGDLIERVEAANDMTSDDYITIRDNLRKFQEVTGVTYIYTLSQGGDGQTKFIVDADPEEPAALGESYDYYEGMEEAFLGSASANKEIYSDEWGSFLSGYAPIKNSEGAVVAILSVDISADSIITQQKEFLRSILIQLFITIVLFIVSTIIICRRIINPVYLLDYKLKELSTAGGDLTKKIEVHTGDEIESLGNSVNGFIANIHKIISAADNISNNINESSSILADSIRQSTSVLEHNTIAIQTVASGAVEQVNEIDTITNQIGSMQIEVDHSNHQIGIINNKIDLSKNYIKSGTQIVSDLNVKTETNLNAFHKVYVKIGDLVVDVNEISEILQSISYISEQINLLALNASIEAARAGEEGKGFSVVANEIKKLAAKTAQSVIEADNIVRRIADDSEEVSSQINLVSETIEMQKKSVEETEHVFYGIQNNVSDLIESIDIINQTFKHVTGSIGEISISMQAISGVVQENAAITEELSASSEEQSAAMCEIENTVKNLKGLCEEMDQTIEKFIL